MFAAPRPITVAAWRPMRPAGSAELGYDPVCRQRRFRPRTSSAEASVGTFHAVAIALPTSRVVPLASSAQAVRAVLLAMAAATLVGRRAISPASHPQLRRRQRATARAP